MPKTYFELIVRCQKCGQMMDLKHRDQLHVHIRTKHNIYQEGDIEQFIADHFVHHQTIEPLDLSICETCEKVFELNDSAAHISHAVVAHSMADEKAARNFIKYKITPYPYGRQRKATVKAVKEYLEDNNIKL